MNMLREVLKNELNTKRYYCPNCGYTWLEFVGLIIEKRNGSDDVHLRIGDGTPSECEKCGCCSVFEISPSEENPQLKGRFEGVKRIVRQIQSEEGYSLKIDKG